MRIPLSSQNPYGCDAKGFLWEVLKARPRGAHLDFGAHDGSVLQQLFSTGVISTGVGLDLNADVVREHQRKMPLGIVLEVITKNAPLPYAAGTFDSISMMGVLEHIHEQEPILREFHRVLKPEGVLVINVPGKHIFSFLDMGNFKFRFPRLHRYYYTRSNSKELYRRRYVEKRNGLVGDIEIEKAWHQHFSHSELQTLLGRCGFGVALQDGYGFFNRPIINTMYFTPNVLRGPLNALRDLDSRLFHDAEIFITAHKIAGL